MASCPNCGFDLNETGVCGVCGYGASSHSRVKTKTRKFGRPIWVVVGAGALVLVAGAAVIVIALAAGRVASRPMQASGTNGHASISPEQSSSTTTSIVGPALALSSTVAEQPSMDPPGATARATGQLDDSSLVGDVTPSQAASQLPAPDYDIANRTDFPPIDSKDEYVQWMKQHSQEEEHYLSEKWDRAQVALARGDIKHRRVLMGFLLTPREDFVRKYNLARSYDDAAIPIGYGQTISGPHIVARMTDALDPQPNMKVLEIGTGSGYQSAFLSELSNYVYTIEIVKPLSDETDSIYKSLYAQYPMYQNIHRRAADGYYGWPEAAPFDRIIVTCAIDHIPPDLLKQLAPGGIMVIPIGPPSGQVVLKITKVVEPDGSVRLEREDIYRGAAKKIFVPFTAEGGGIHSLATDPSGGQ